MPRWPGPRKYEPLGAYLAQQPTDTVTLTVGEIAAILGTALPPTAHSPSFWSNHEGNDVARQWRRVGWRVAKTHWHPDVDAVTFARVPSDTIA